MLVDDPAAALAFAASAVYGHPSFSLEVVGITGTNGKTTTVHLVRAAIDGALGSTLRRHGNRRPPLRRVAMPAEHTTPEADDVARTMAEMRARGATHVAMEVSSHALALGRVRGVRVRVAALTNLTQDHLDFHGSMQAYAEAKARLFTELGPGAAVLNVDDAFGRDLAARVRAPLVRVSARTDADARPPNRAARREPRGEAHAGHGAHPRRRRDPRVAPRRRAQPREPPSRAGHRARARARSRAAADALSREPGAPGRLERCDGEGDDVTVLVDYAHTPDALARALDAVRAVTAGRVWCVFGCGGDRDATKRAPMGEAVGAARRRDGRHERQPAHRGPRAIAAQVAGSARRGREPVVELDRRKAIDLAVRSASRGDVVLSPARATRTTRSSAR